MVTLLRRLFIKNYQDTSSEKVRTSHGTLAAVFGIITNAILVALKLTSAFVMAAANNWIFSMAVLGDAINNAGDMASSIVTLVGFKLASKPADKEHPFGHERIEYIAALVIAMLIIAAGLELFRSSLEAAIDGTVTTYDNLALIILGISIALKLFQAYVNRGLGKAIDSVPLKATALDSLTDSIATTCVLISAILTRAFSWGFLDAYLGMAVSLFILYSGIRTVKDSSDPLIGTATDRGFEEKIVQDVLSHPEVLGVHDVLCHSYGPTKMFVSLHAEVDAKNKLADIHDVIDNIEDEIRAKYGCEITIHMDPIAVGDPLTDELKAEAKKTLISLDPSLTIHDFRVVAGETHTNVIFDVVIPYDEEKLSGATILEYLQKNFKGGDPRYHFVLHFDRPYDE